MNDIRGICNALSKRFSDCLFCKNIYPTIHYTYMSVVVIV